MCQFIAQLINSMLGFRNSYDCLPAANLVENGNYLLQLKSIHVHCEVVVRFVAMLSTNLKFNNFFVYYNIFIATLRRI